MTDLHTHILPAMDDGAKTLESARELLSMELAGGTDRVALTSHFSCEYETVESFLSRREAAFRELSRVCPDGMKLKRGCEVYYSPVLTQLDLKALCLEGTNYLLMELPLLSRPPHLELVLEELRFRDIVPVLAHVERYAYVRRDPGLTAQWIREGALIQVNARSVRDGDGLTLRLLKWGLAQVVASDAHSAAHRPPDLAAAMAVIKKRLGEAAVQSLEENARAIFDGEAVQVPEPHVPRKVLGFWI